MPNQKLFETRANGKLLLSGEYFVLDGALALAVPVKFGQTLKVQANPKTPQLAWESRDWDGSVWFEAWYELPYLSVIETNDRSAAEMLASIIRECQRQNPDFIAGTAGLTVRTTCDFPRIWGLGTSSTIIATIAKWAQVDAYPVLFNTLGGSGYDIACAYAGSSLLYQLKNGLPNVRVVSFDPSFSAQLYFVYLEKKQNSREGIVRYRELAREMSSHIPEISSLTERMLVAETLSDFEAAMHSHEKLVASALNFVPVKERLFSDYWGEIKSLGAWGGDFVLVTSTRPAEETKQYFSQRGYKTVLQWTEMVL